MGIIFSKYRCIYCIYFTLPLCRAIYGSDWTSAHFFSLLYCKYDLHIVLPLMCLSRETSPDTISAKIDFFRS